MNNPSIYLKALNMKRIMVIILVRGTGLSTVFSCTVTDNSQDSHRFPEKGDRLPAKTGLYKHTTDDCSNLSITEIHFHPENRNTLWRKGYKTNPLKKQPSAINSACFCNPHIQICAQG